MGLESEVNLGEKIATEDAGGGPLLKKVRTGGGLDVGVVGNMKKVSEMVLLLAAMGKMRGGRVPSQVENDIMSAAREKLAEVCQCFPPKDVFPRDVFGAITEDLGLNRIKEQRKQFRPPDVTIAEKFLISKEKMDKSDDFSVPPAARGSLHLPTNSGTSSLPYQLPTSEIRPMVSSGLPSNHLGRNPTTTLIPRSDSPHFKVDRRSNGHSHLSQLQATNSGDNRSVQTPTWSMQSQSLRSTKVSTEAKVPMQNMIKLEGLQVKNTVQAPILGNSHAEIGKFVLKVKQPESSDLPVWFPPSRDYMNRTLLCQVCMSNINDMDSVLVCDSCEKGFHLKCLQINNARGIPKGDWYCRKCLQSSHVKPLPSKYGRVMRNIGAPKVTTTTSSIPVSSNKKDGSMDEKINHHKTLPNGNTAMQTAPSVSTSGVQENDIVDGKRGEESSSEPNSRNTSPASCMNISSPLSDHSQPPKQPCDNHIMDRTLNDSCRAESLCDKVTQETSNEQANSASTLTIIGNGSPGLERLVSDAVSTVDWVGDTLRVDDNKIFYHSCNISGVVYKLEDNVLIQFPDNRVIPSKLQSMWEDSMTKSKWVAVNRYYFPGDLPEAVGRPCSLENNEVYESTYNCTAIAGMIRGLCYVLPPNKFAVEKERQNSLGMGSNENLWPLYFCKWIYDESKALFHESKALFRES